jgi:hypothetical protein
LSFWSTETRLAFTLYRYHLGKWQVGDPSVSK